MQPLLIVLLLAAPALAADPASELRIALHDAKTHPLPRQARYVTSYALPADLQKNAPVALSLVMNSVSRSSRMVQAVRISETVWRIDLAAYGLDPKLWESMVADEPYFHQKVQVLDPKTGKRQTVYTDGGWVGLDDATALRTITGSGGALMRLDYFVSKVSVPPLYYSFAGIGEKFDDLAKLVGLDEKTVIALRAAKGENILNSGVTNKVRRISRKPTPFGAFWLTHDSDGKNIKSDFIRNPGFFAEAEAHEGVVSKANGLYLYALWDANYKRVDAAPDFIARDFTDVHGDQRLVPMRSCVSCHAKDGGLRVHATDQTDIFKRGANLLFGDPVTIEELAAFYDAPRLAVQFKRDIEDYQAAVKLATGMDADGAAKALVEIYDYHDNGRIDAKVAARELGLGEFPQLTDSTDGILVSLLLGKSVSRAQWIGSWPEAAVKAGRR